MSIISRFKKRLPILGSSAVPARPAEPAGAGAPPPSAMPPPAPENERGDQDVAEFIAGLVKDNPITLFMKGTANQPQCGFSANASAILQSYGHAVKHVDVLMDPDIRQGIKDFSSWPTIPQIYVGAEFLGGSDILAQMHEAGELAEVLEAALGASEG